MNQSTTSTALHTTIRRGDVAILLGPGTAEGQLPPRGTPRDRQRAQHALDDWRRRHRPALRALAQAVAALPARCLLSFSLEKDTGAWLRDVSPHWNERSHGRHDGARLIDLIDDPASALSLGLAQVVFDLRRLQDGRWIAAKARCHDSPLLAVGFHPEDADLRNLLRELRRRTPGRPGWILCREALSSTSWSAFDEMGFVPVVTDPLALLHELRRGDEARQDAVGTTAASCETGSRARAAPAEDRSPYRLLDAYTPGDAAIFFGRNALSNRLQRLVSAYRLVVVTGASGSGKTSLINAGLLAPLRRKPNVVAVTVRCDVDAVGEIVARLESALDGAARSTFDGSLSGYLDRIRRHRFPIIVLDQAEEIYTRLGERPREELLSALRRCLSCSPQVAAFVISLREDYLAGLSDLRASVPTLLQTTLYVPPLAPDEAREAILGPAQQAALVFADDVVDTIIVELASGNRGAVAPPQLQVVCSLLYNEWRSCGGPARGIERTLYDKLEGCRGLLGSFVERSLAALHSAGDEDIGWAVLKAMVTSEGTKDLLTADEIASRAKLAVSLVQRLLHEFRDGPRLVRALGDDRGWRYELAHEYLVESIWRRMSEHERRQRSVEEDLTRELRAWEHFSDVRLGVDRLKRYAEFPELVARNERALTLVLLSTIKSLQPGGIWMDIVAGLPGAAQDRIARTLLEYVCGTDRMRQRESAELLARFDGAVLLKAVKAADAGVRAAAIRVAAAIGLPAIAPVLVETLSDRDAPLPLQRDALAGLLRSWLPNETPDAALLPGEAGMIDALLAAPAERQRFACGAVLDLGGYSGLCGVLKRLLAKKTRAVVISELTPDRSARLGRFLRYPANRANARALWPALTDIPSNPEQQEIVRELLQLAIWSGGRWVHPTSTPGPSGWPMSPVELEIALSKTIQGTWLERGLRTALAYSSDLAALSDDGLMAATKDNYSQLAILQDRALVRRALELLAASGDFTNRSLLVHAILDVHARNFDRATWLALLADKDVDNRAFVSRLAVQVAPFEIAGRGLTDPEELVQRATLEALVAHPRLDEAAGWAPLLHEHVTRSAQPRGDVRAPVTALIAAASLGLVEVALLAYNELPPDQLGKVLAHASAFLPNASVPILADIVQATLSESYAPFDVIAPDVLRSLAKRWSALDENQRDKLVQFALHHKSSSIRSAAVAFAVDAARMDLLQFLLVDPSPNVQESAWKHYLEFAPEEVAVDSDVLGHVIADEKRDTRVRAAACRVAQHHRITHVINALKAVADSDRVVSPERETPYAIAPERETLGAIARSALLALWPESAAWIRSTL